MTQRKGEITLPQIKRKWPHHVALPAETVHGVTTSQAIWGFAATLSAVPRPYSARHGDSELVVICFSKPEDAQAFAERFGGEKRPMTAVGSKNTVRRWHLTAAIPEVYNSVRHPASHA